MDSDSRRRCLSRICQCSPQQHGGGYAQQPQVLPEVETSGRQHRVKPAHRQQPLVPRAAVALSQVVGHLPREALSADHQRQPAAAALSQAHQEEPLVDPLAPAAEASLEELPLSNG